MENEEKQVITEEVKPVKKSRKKKEVIEETEEPKLTDEEKEEQDKKEGSKKYPNPNYLAEINWNDGYQSKPYYIGQVKDNSDFGKFYDEERNKKYAKGWYEQKEIENAGGYSIPTPTKIIFNIYLLKGYFLHHIDKFQNGLTAIENSFDNYRLVEIITEEIEKIFEENKDKDSDLHKLFINLFRIKAHSEKLRIDDSFFYEGGSSYNLNYGPLSNMLIESKGKYTKKELLKYISEKSPDVSPSFLQKIYLYLINNHGDKINTDVKKKEENEEENEDITEDDE